MEIVAAGFIILVGATTLGSVAVGARQAAARHRRDWAEVAESLRLTQKPAFSLGTQGASGTIDGFDVSVVRPSPLAVLHSDLSGDQIAYSIRWQPPAERLGIRLSYIHNIEGYQQRGKPVLQSSLEGLRLLSKDTDAFAEWFTPERAAAVETLLSDGTGNRHPERTIDVREDRLRLSLPWRARSPEEIVVTTERLLDVARVLREGGAGPTQLEAPGVHPLDAAVAAIQDAPPEPAPSVATPEAHPIPDESIDAVVPFPADPAPNVMVDHAPDLSVPTTVAELLDRSLMAHEATARFDEGYRNRTVEWSGQVGSFRQFSSDPDFTTPGVRVMVLVHRIDDSPLVTNQVHAIVHLPEGTELANGQSIRFTGRLHRLDRTMRNLFVADGALT